MKLDINQPSGLIKLFLDGNVYVLVPTTDVPLEGIVGKMTPLLNYFLIHSNITGTIFSVDTIDGTKLMVT